MMMKNKRPTRPRTKKHPVPWSDFIKGRFGNVEIEIKASRLGWEVLRRNALADPDFADNFRSSIIEPAIASINEPRKDHDAHINFIKMIILSALLYRHFEGCKTRTLLETVMRYMGRLFPEKKNDVFDPLRNSIPGYHYDRAATARFKIGYVNKGEKILNKLSQNQNVDKYGRSFYEPLFLLEFHLGILMNQAKSVRIRKDAALARELVETFIEGL